LRTKKIPPKILPKTHPQTIVSNNTNKKIPLKTHNKTYSSKQFEIIQTKNTSKIILKHMPSSDFKRHKKNSPNISKKVIV